MPGVPDSAARLARFLAAAAPCRSLATCAADADVDAAGYDGGLLAAARESCRRERRHGGGAGWRPTHVVVALDDRSDAAGGGRKERLVRTLGWMGTGCGQRGGSAASADEDAAEAASTMTTTTVTSFAWSGVSPSDADQSVASYLDAVQEGLRRLPAAADPAAPSHVLFFASALSLDEGDRDSGGSSSSSGGGFFEGLRRGVAARPDGLLGCSWVRGAEVVHHGYRLGFDFKDALYYKDHLAGASVGDQRVAASTEVVDVDMIHPCCAVLPVAAFANGSSGGGGGSGLLQVPPVDEGRFVELACDAGDLFRTLETLLFAAEYVQEALGVASGAVNGVLARVGISRRPLPSSGGGGVDNGVAYALDSDEQVLPEYLHNAAGRVARQKALARASVAAALRGAGGGEARHRARVARACGLGGEPGGALEDVVLGERTRRAVEAERRQADAMRVVERCAEGGGGGEPCGALSAVEGVLGALEAALVAAEQVSSELLPLARMRALALPTVDWERGVRFFLQAAAATGRRPMAASAARVRCCAFPEGAAAAAAVPDVASVAAAFRSPSIRYKEDRGGAMSAGSVPSTCPAAADASGAAFQVALAPPLAARVERFVRGGGRSERLEAGLTVVWMGWCCMCCGFSNEWVRYLVPLERRVRIFSTEGLPCHCSGFSADTVGAILRTHVRDAAAFAVPKDDVYVTVAHKPPDAYHTGISGIRRSPDYFVGRSMYEFSRLPPGWAARCNSDSVDEVWVPARFVADAFVRSGVSAAKLRVVPEALDTFFYSPTAARGSAAFANVTAEPVFPPVGWRQYSNRGDAASLTPRTLAKRFVFLSLFKWEPRKGWDVLVGGYLKRFWGEAVPLLLVSTWLWRSGPVETWGDTRDPALFRERVAALLDAALLSDGHGAGGGDAAFADTLRADCRARGVERCSGGVLLESPACPHLVVVTESLSEESVRVLYALADSFVLPTRGEGWGLPIVQAMSMGLPTIATNYGGSAAFLTRRGDGSGGSGSGSEWEEEAGEASVSYPIRVKGVAALPEDAQALYNLKSAEWAEPDQRHMEELMWHVYTRPEEGKEVCVVWGCLLFLSTSWEGGCVCRHRPSITGRPACAAARVREVQRGSGGGHNTRAPASY